MFLVFFLLGKFGVTACFTIVFTSHSYFFPTLFAATAMGICNFFARLFSALSFVVESLDEPTPMIIFTSLCIFTALISFFLRTEKKEKE